ncbi:MAG: FAD-containing oxidoreductase [Gammaproteobacteria bacterium]
MTEAKSFDAIIIGAGQAGPPLAARLTAAGMSVAIIERDQFGGTCVNYGCMPSKTLVASAYAAHIARRAADFGVVLGGPVSVDMEVVRGRVRTIVRHARANVETSLRRMSGCTVFEGHARFNAPHELRVGRVLLKAPRIFLNVGARAVTMGVPGATGERCLTHRTILDLDRVPEHLAIVGGSFVGIEFAQVFRRFGAEVTVFEEAQRILKEEDPDVSAEVSEMLVHEGISICTRSRPVRFREAAAAVVISVACDEAIRDVRASHVLLALGRRPNTDRLGLKQAGVATDRRGYIVVNERLETSVPGIWALGECNGRGAFTHTAYNDFEIVAANLLEGASRTLSDRISCYALFTDPPLARVGMSPGQARAAGHEIRVGRRSMTRVGRATEKDERQGFMQIVVDAASDAILGATILGTGGDEAIHCVLDMMVNHATATALRHAVHIHPTVAELLPTIAGEAC